MRSILKTMFFLTLAPCAQPEEIAKKPTPPTIESLDNGRHRIGKITFDSQKKSISLPAFVEQTEVLVEYLLVTPVGKIHESVFITDIKPSNLNIALKLLDFQESKELLPVLDENFAATEKFHTATKDQKQNSRFSITATWQTDGKTTTRNVNQLVLNIETKKSMTAAPWIYSGSYLHKGKFKAEINGDLLAIFTDRSAIANYSGKGRLLDTIWVPDARKLPEAGTPVTLTLTKTSHKHP